MRATRAILTVVFVFLCGGAQAGLATEDGETVLNGRIAYIRGSLKGVTDVASIRPSGEGFRNLTWSEPNELYVAVSPEGGLVAFTRLGRHGSDIFTIPIKGGEWTRLTSDRVHDELPI